MKLLNDAIAPVVLLLFLNPVGVCQDSESEFHKSIDLIAKLYNEKDRRFSDILNRERILALDVQQCIRTVGIVRTVDLLDTGRPFELYYTLGTLLSGSCSVRRFVITHEEREQVFQAICKRLMDDEQLEFREAYVQYVVWSRKLDFGTWDDRSIESFGVRLNQICTEEFKPFWERVAMLIVLQHLFDLESDHLTFDILRDNLDSQIEKLNAKNKVLEAVELWQFELVGGFKYQKIPNASLVNIPKSREDFFAEFRRRLPGIVPPMLPFPQADTGLTRFLDCSESNREFRDTAW